MQILNTTIHNFRSVVHCTFNLGDYSLMVGANNSGKSNVMDALRIFYEKELNMNVKGISQKLIQKIMIVGLK